MSRLTLSPEDVLPMELSLEAVQPVKGGRDVGVTATVPVMPKQTRGYRVSLSVCPD